ncbi:MAG: uracil phosphoribosyltransferase [Thermoprotei archaeon]
MEYEDVIVIENNLAKYYLTILRNKDTPPKLFRKYLRKLGFILGYEASRYLKWRSVFVETPLARASGVKPGKPVIIVGILGASIPLVEGILEAIPWAGVGLVAARRIESVEDVEIEVYYERLPETLEPYTVLIADPMLATGKTMVATIELLKKRGASDLVILSVIASRYGINYVRSKAGKIPIIVVAIDPYLNDKFFIVPGLGDAGDRGLGHDKPD